MVKIVLDKIKNGKIKDFDTDFFHDEEYTFEFEDGTSITVRLGEMPTLLFGWWFSFDFINVNCNCIRRRVYQSYNPFKKLWVMYVVRKRYYELVKEMLNK